MATELRLEIVPEDESLSAQQLEALVLDLKSEIEQSSDYRIPVNETQREKKGTLGAEWIPVLTAILSAPVAIETIKGLYAILGDWIKRRKTVKVTVKGPKGEFVITTENMSGDEVERMASKII